MKFLMRLMCWVEDKLDFWHDKYCPCSTPVVNYDCVPCTCCPRSDESCEECDGQG